MACTLNRCTLTGNWAEYCGGGAHHSTLNNCLVAGNAAATGGGACGGTLNNCTVTGNSAECGGGAGGLYWPGFVDDRCFLNNCIVYFNTARAGADYWGVVTLNFCCTTPLPSEGMGNIDLDPELAGPAHVSIGSPCRGAGSAAYVSGTDIDGEVWETPPSIGCDEYHAGGIIGPLRVAITADYTNVAVGFAPSFTARVVGHPSANVWDCPSGVTPRKYGS